MRNGDLSNRVSPRVVLVFEGALGFCTDTRKFDRQLRRGHFEEATRFWEINSLLAGKILHLNYYKDVTFEVVTFIGGDEWAAELGYYLEDLPLHRVWATTPEKLGRKIAYMPDLACVYDPEPKRWLMYGTKGRFLTSVNQIGEGM